MLRIRLFVSSKMLWGHSWIILCVLTACFPSLGLGKSPVPEEYAFFLGGGIFVLLVVQHKATY